MARSGRRTARRLAYGCPLDFIAANRSPTSRLPIPRNAAMAARFFPLGRALPCSQAYTLCPDAPTSNPKSAADKPRRLRLLAMPEAQNRNLSEPSASSTAGGDGGRAGAARADKFRFRASGMASNRKRLGLSAADFGLLVGASGQSVYAWEQGKARPRVRNLAAIAALRGVGKREVVERLAALKSGEQS